MRAYILITNMIYIYTHIYILINISKKFETILSNLAIIVADKTKRKKKRKQRKTPQINQFWLQKLITIKFEKKKQSIEILTQLNGVHPHTHRFTVLGGRMLRPMLRVFYICLVVKKTNFYI